MAASVPLPMGTPTPMSSGQTTEPIVEPSQSEPTGSGPPPQPEPLRELQVFLLGLLRSQCVLIGAAGGAIFVSTGGGRPPSLMSQHQEAEDAPPVLIPAVISRMERLAREVCLPQDGKPVTGLTDMIALPKSASMYGEEARQRLVAAPLWADGRIEGARAYWH